MHAHREERKETFVMVAKQDEFLYKYSKKVQANKFYVTTS